MDMIPKTSQNASMTNSTSPHVTTTMSSVWTLFNVSILQQKAVMKMH